MNYVFGDFYSIHKVSLKINIEISVIKQLYEFKYSSIVNKYNVHKTAVNDNNDINNVSYYLNKNRYGSSSNKLPMPFLSYYYVTYVNS